jgi:hypothetical protein
VVAIADVNGDGKLDVLAGMSYPGFAIAVLLGRGDGTFQSPILSPTGSIPFSIAVGDFNGDGNPDVAVAQRDSNTVAVLLGNGDGTFQSGRSFAVGRSPVFITAGDLDGNGTVDLATANSNSNSVSVLLGVGDGTFQAAFDSAAGLNPASVAISDFNGDGLLDLAVANSGSNTVSVLLNSLTPTAHWLPQNPGTESLVFFKPGAEFGVGTDPIALAAGDFNGDGKPDLATAKANSRNVSVLINSTP